TPRFPSPHPVLIFRQCPPSPCFFSFLFRLPLLKASLFPYTTLFRSSRYGKYFTTIFVAAIAPTTATNAVKIALTVFPASTSFVRSEEHTSELQSRFDLVCRLLLLLTDQYIVCITSDFVSSSLY